jgi:hypothetical protein
MRFFTVIVATIIFVSSSVESRVQREDDITVAEVPIRGIERGSNEEKKNKKDRGEESIEEEIAEAEELIAEAEESTAEVEEELAEKVSMSMQQASMSIHTAITMSNQKTSKMRDGKASGGSSVSSTSNKAGKSLMPSPSPTYLDTTMMPTGGGKSGKADGSRGGKATKYGRQHTDRRQIITSTLTLA